MPRPIGPNEGQRRNAVEILGGVARSAAHPAATFYRALREEGLTPDEARGLTGEFLRVLLGDIRATLGE
ncbi:MAG: hypothetical protein K2R93_12310 [Gemmatimonadaceae bacterium]|nr:hypothetical protein [Gemmatimonadaceae bacterium]